MRFGKIFTVTALLAGLAAPVFAASSGLQPADMHERSRLAVAQAMTAQATPAVMVQTGYYQSSTVAVSPRTIQANDLLQRLYDRELMPEDIIRAMRR